MYKIMGKYRGQTEELDEAETKEQADQYVYEYRHAYGGEWLIWIEKDGEAI